MAQREPMSETQARGVRYARELEGHLTWLDTFSGTALGVLAVASGIYTYLGVSSLLDDNGAMSAFAANLLQMTPPPEVPFEAAGLSPMAQSFYVECKRVSNARAKAALGWRPLYPTYREGLRAVLAAEDGR